MTATLKRMGRQRPPRQPQPQPEGDTPPPNQTGGGSVTVRVAPDLARMLSQIAIHRNITVSELLSPQIRSWVLEQYRRMVREMADALEKSAEAD